MANLRKRLSENVKGEFFVDSTCIDCDACRQLAPATFGEGRGYSFVFSQPQTEDQKRNALQALLACPTGSIGTRHSNNSREIIREFPLNIENNTYYCGFNSPKSYGGNSYFIQHPDGNWLIDSPKYIPHLIKQFTESGGIQYIFLTHRDDVADAAQYAEKFASKRIIHRLELSAQPEAEIVIEGLEPVQFSPEFQIIPTPGHTRGHSVLLYKNKYLFTGDHLWWERNDNRLGAGRDVCWYSWPEQTRSMRKLLHYDFEWVIPGHGQCVKLSREEKSYQLQTLIDWMEGL
jgi:glyoxylase-like metal-dependent hydrolase (beta-lactamase superfamily II)/ferredoxin